MCVVYVQRKKSNEDEKIKIKIYVRKQKHEKGEWDTDKAIQKI